MVIPQGKKFKFIGTKLGGNTDSEVMEIPRNGYLGNAYIGQDINLNVVNNYASPLASLLDKVPHIMDIAFRTKGISIKNHRFTSMKYWVGSEPMDLDFQFIFETQVDSYYDVYVPITDLLNLASPGETNEGFFIPPTPSLKLIANQGVKFFKGLAARGPEGIKGAANLAVGTITDLSSKLLSPGFQIDLRIGGVFQFATVLIKNVTPTFSSELAYAPIYAINERLIARGATPLVNYYRSESITKLIAQTLGALKAFSKAGIAAIPSVLPGPLQKLIQGVGVIPSFPMRAEVNVSLELQFPMVKSQKGLSSTSKRRSGTEVDSVFPAANIKDKEGKQIIPFKNPGQPLGY